MSLSHSIYLNLGHVYLKFRHAFSTLSELCKSQIPASHDSNLKCSLMDCIHWSSRPFISHLELSDARDRSVILETAPISELTFNASHRQVWRPSTHSDQFPFVLKLSGPITTIHMIIWGSDEDRNPIKKSRWYMSKKLLAEVVQDIFHSL